MSKDPPKVISTVDRALFREIERLLARYGFEICAPSKNPQIRKALRSTGRNLTVLLLNGEPTEWGGERGLLQDEALPIGLGEIKGNSAVAQWAGRQRRPGSDESGPQRQSAFSIESPSNERS